MSLSPSLGSGTGLDPGAWVISVTGNRGSSVATAVGGWLFTGALV